MSIVKSILMLSWLLFLVSCNQHEGYHIDYDGNTISIYMHRPKVGISSLFSVDYDGFSPNDIKKDIYDHLEGESGVYNVYVTFQRQDDYGYWQSEPQSHFLLQINADELNNCANPYCYNADIVGRIEDVRKGSTNVIDLRLDRND